MARIRILVVDMPRLVREMLVRAVAAQPDMNVVAAVAEPDDLLATARRTRPDFVIIGLADDELPPDCRTLLREQPAVKVLGVAATAGVAYLYELRPEMRAIGEMSPEDIVEAIRSAAASPSLL